MAHDAFLDRLPSGRLVMTIGTVATKTRTVA